MIKDGKGRGYLAGVNKENKLEVYATIESAAAYAAQNGDYFLISNAGNHVGGDGYVLHLINDSTTRRMHIEKIQISAVAQGFWHIGHSGVYGSNGTLVDAVNLYISSNKTADATAYRGADGNQITLSTSPTFFNGGHLIAYTKITENFAGDLVLGKDDTLSLYCETNDSSKVAASIQFYFEDF